MQTGKLPLPSAADLQPGELPKIWAVPTVLINAEGEVISSEGPNSSSATATLGTVAAVDTFTSLPSTPARRVTLQNPDASLSITVRKGTGMWTLLPLSSKTFNALSNASNLEVKRKDGLGSPLTVEFEIENW